MGLPHRTIVAISGRKFHGKDTIAKEFIEQAGFVQMNFADPVKDVCAEMFGIERRLFDDPTLKEMQLKRWPYVTPRKTLQDLAQQMRNLYPDVWVQHFLRRLAHTAIWDERIVISDLRYPNEVDCIVQLGGTICFVTRPALEEQSAKDTHESESYYAYIKSKAYYQFMNDRDLIHLQSQAHKFLIDHQLMTNS